MNIGKNKIAIVHDSFTQFGGAERVLFHLIKIFPNADVYTSLISDKFQKEIKKISTGKLTFSKLSKLSFAINYASFFKPYFYHYYWESLNLDKYDLVISSSHSFCAHFVNVKNKHLCYMYTTPRFLHDEYNEISWIKKRFIKKIFYFYSKFLKKKNYKKIKKIDTLIAVSINVQKRIRKYYNLPAEVIYPPIDTSRTHEITNNFQKNNYYLFFSRLVKQKGLELVIKTFNHNQKSLIVVGTGSQETKWKKIANKNIKFLGFVQDRKIPKLFYQSKALIYASIDEDFGMIPVEAMSCGLPIIAYQSGGVKETIINKKTGLFFNKHSQKSLNFAINRFEEMIFNKNNCIKQAIKFDKEIFYKKIIKKINKLINE